MKTDRRKFLKKSAGAAILMAAGNWPAIISARSRMQRLVVLHTNDVHSRIDPFPLNDPKFPGAGGFARRSALIKRIRKEEENVLLLDAGDIFQGTPYFNLFNGEPEIRLMTEMGYDASAIGNHDFDGGIINLAERMKQAGFPFLCANYDFSDTPASGGCSPFKVFEKDRMRIGVFGLGIELNGLVDPSSCGNTRYLDPVMTASKMVRLMRHDYGCDMVICLSHLGYRYDSEKISDVRLANSTSGIDLIIGGHTHTFLDQPVSCKNVEGKMTTIVQAGWGGVRLGRVDFDFNGSDTKKSEARFMEKTFYYTIA
ncbi:MAG: bifunctional metallophosphatase/5'-nucleotidase [Bacteroidota bacterium]